MFVSAWHFALIAIFIGAAVYKYIEYEGAKKDWGDGLKGWFIFLERISVVKIFFITPLIKRIYGLYGQQRTEAGTTSVR